MDNHWTSVWGSAISIAENRPAAYAKDITFRYPIYSHFGGSAVKLTFDNYCGTEPVVFDKVTVMIDEKFIPVTFSGKRTAQIAAGGRLTSDEIHHEIKPKSLITISFWFRDFTLLRSAVFTSGPLTEGYYAMGDLTETVNIPDKIVRPTGIFYFLSNVSVLTSCENRSIVCYGDSITAQDWPDYLALRCISEGKDNTSIVRRAASGTRLLREYDSIVYESYGLMGKKRFAHEVPTDGADTVIIQHGINDIIHPVGTEVNPFRPMSDMPTAAEMISVLEYYISEARGWGYKVYIGTLLPIEGWRTYAPFREEVRAEFNDWIRTTPLIDGCIDFDKALADPEQPTKMLAKFDSGDHLHPSKLGYKQMAGTIPDELLK